MALRWDKKQAASTQGHPQWTDHVEPGTKGKQGATIAITGQMVGPREKSASAAKRDDGRSA